MTEPEPSSAPLAAPGWYDNPHMEGTQRYWDGWKFTGHVAPVQAPQPGLPPTKQSRSQAQRLAIIAAGCLVGWLVLGTALGLSVQGLLHHAGATGAAQFYAGGIAAVAGIAIGAMVGRKIAGPRGRAASVDYSRLNENTPDFP